MNEIPPGATGRRAKEAAPPEGSQGASASSRMTLLFFSFLPAVLRGSPVYTPPHRRARGSEDTISPFVVVHSFGETPISFRFFPCARFG